MHVMADVRRSSGNPMAYVPDGYESFSTSAFLNAARSVIDWLALSAHYAIPGDAKCEMEPDERAITA
jgi:hypothetical protein